MNERIDQLMVKAGAYFGGEGVVYDTFDPKKFAELIVRECADIINHRANTCGDNLDSIKANKHVRNEQRECATTIKQHFGVEE